MEVIQKIEQILNCKIYNLDLIKYIIKMIKTYPDEILCVTFFDDHLLLYAWNNKWHLWDDIGHEFNEEIVYGDSFSQIY